VGNQQSYSLTVPNLLINILSNYSPVNLELCSIESCCISLYVNTPLTCYSHLPTEKPMTCNSKI